MPKEADEYTYHLVQDVEPNYPHLGDGFCTRPTITEGQVLGTANMRHGSELEAQGQSGGKQVGVTSKLLSRKNGVQSKRQPSIDDEPAKP